MVCGFGCVMCLLWRSEGAGMILLGVVDPWMSWGCLVIGGGGVGVVGASSFVFSLCGDVVVVCGVVCRCVVCVINMYKKNVSGIREVVDFPSKYSSRVRGVVCIKVNVV